MHTTCTSSSGVSSGTLHSSNQSSAPASCLQSATQTLSVSAAGSNASPPPLDPVVSISPLDPVVSIASVSPLDPDVPISPLDPVGSPGPELVPASSPTHIPYSARDNLSSTESCVHEQPPAHISPTVSSIGSPGATHPASSPANSPASPPGSAHCFGSQRPMLAPYTDRPPLSPATPSTAFAALTRLRGAQICPRAARTTLSTHSPIALPPRDPPVYPRIAMGTRRYVVMCIALACSPTDAPPPAKPATPAIPTVATTTPPVPTPPAPPAETCLREAPVSEAPAKTWQLIGTTRERPSLHALPTRVFVSAGPRLYDAGPDEPLAASTKTTGLPRKPVAQMFGTWPDDVWLTTLEGELRGGGGGQRFHLWRWHDEKWSRQSKKELFGDSVAELRTWTPGRLLELRCDERPNLGLVAHGGDGNSPPPLARASATSFCPEATLTTSGGDLYALDHATNDPLTVHVVRRCNACSTAETATLPVPRRCDRPAPTILWGMLAPRQPDPNQVVLAVHTSAPDDRGQNQQIGAYLLRRDRDTWIPELVPGDGSITGLDFAADGTLWLRNDRLLRRSPTGAWHSLALPDAASTANLTALVTLGDELWIALENTVGDRSTWSIHRSGAPTTALDLDTGKPLKKSG